MYNMIGGERVRNPNGYGTVTKLSGKRRKPWIVKITVGYDANGKQIQKSIGTFENRKAALNCLAIYNSERHDPAISNNLVINSKQDRENEIHTFGECFNLYIEREQGRRSLSWVRSKKYAAKKLSSIMDTDIKQIDLFTIQSIIDDLKVKQQSESSLNACKILCTQVFEYAVIHKWLDRNDDYTKYIDISTKVERSTIHKPFNADEIDVLKNDDEFMSKILLVYIFTGCRASELLDVERYDDHILCGLKTEAGKNRKIPIHSYIEPFIDDVLKYLSTISYPNLRSQFMEYSEKKFEEKHYLHDTRNTFATLGRECGMKTTAIKKIMGHRLNDITDDIYIHESISYLKTEIEKIKIV